MARIKTYDLDATITNADKIIGTDGAEGANNATKNFTVAALKTFINEDAGVLAKKSVTVTSTQLLALNGGGTIELIPAPGASYR